MTESATPTRANEVAPPRRKLCPLYRSALGTRAATNAWRNALVSALRVSGLPSSIANKGESSLILYRRLILASMYFDIALAGPKLHDSGILYHREFRLLVIRFDNINIIVCIVHRHTETSPSHRHINRSSSSHHIHHIFCSHSS